jgi:hypothetical protein
MNRDIAIDRRLAALPPKVAQPFRQLLAAGQLTDDVVATLLDAGELAGDSAKLLGFAIAYLHLRAQGVPVHDVIRMAKDQGRHINLAWSPKRWSAEHDRLARSEALRRLAEENVAYDVARYAALLPPRFSGYLIRTSRRLGMEGLRQRHCVASYHARLQAGSCAIAAVFAGRRRWTVQLILTDNPVQPLQIAQVRTRFNEQPTSELLKRIHETLGIEPARVPAGPAPHCAEGRAYLRTLRRLLPVLRDHGVETVTVTFDGSGDEGSINDIAYTPHAIAEAARAVAVAFETVSSHFEDGRWITVAEPAQGSLDDALEALTDDYLEETGVDWYNDDGGFGELVIDVREGTVALEVNTRYINSTNEFSSERDIFTGEEL